MSNGFAEDAFLSLRAALTAGDGSAAAAAVAVGDASPVACGREVGGGVTAIVLPESSSLDPHKASRYHVYLAALEYLKRTHFGVGTDAEMVG
jgi:hypothetical protein